MAGIFGNLKACIPSDILPPPRTHLLSSHLSTGDQEFRQYPVGPILIQTNYSLKTAAPGLNGSSVSSCCFTDSLSCLFCLILNIWCFEWRLMESSIWLTMCLECQLNGLTLILNWNTKDMLPKCFRFWLFSVVVIVGSQTAKKVELCLVLLTTEVAVSQACTVPGKCFWS